jgi:hypothetical protein
MQKIKERQLRNTENEKLKKEIVKKYRKSKFKK